MKTPRFIERLLGMRPIQKLEKGFSSTSYDGKRIITDEEVFVFVKKHSNLIDRLDPRKMVEMSIWAQTMLLQPHDNWNGVEPNDDSWKFYPDFLDWFMTPKKARNRKTTEVNINDNHKRN